MIIVIMTMRDFKLFMIQRNFTTLPVTIGVIRPLGVATATEISTLLPISITPEEEDEE